ncbi:MAG: bifunctional diaminohydroxyphosphoribosylaminopyrimidine deaminase/5-amino-6-(5-phosphoribosylamino)uracil reductase RibD [Bacteroidota bacterium]
MYRFKDEIFMRRALELAERGRGAVSPNPMVGCVIVYQSRIIGEGWHQRCGEAHAEVNAVNSVADKSLLKESTVYVTLEPCSHYGKTPPCADLLVKHEVNKVIIANRDPFPKVDGNGIQKLEDAGIKVEVGLLQQEGKDLNKRFFTFHGEQRPYIMLKWAQTADGFVARENFDSKWISNQYSRKLVHKWRGEEDAILVGTSTARYDNPSLTTRDWGGKNPLRLVIDKNLKLDPSLNLFDRSTPTICYNQYKCEKEENLEFVKTTQENLIEDIITDLYQRNIQSLFVEGGSKLLQSFIDKGLWDEARVFESEKLFSSGVKSPIISNDVYSMEKADSDFLRIFSASKHFPIHQ